MATSFQFGNQTITLPGIYGNIRSGIQNPPINEPYGNLLVIDTGTGAGWGAGAGVNGEFSQDKQSILEFDNIDDFQAAMKGGLWYLLANPLFEPDGPGVSGVSKIFFMKAATTTGARMRFDFFGDGHRSISQSGGAVNGGTLIIGCLDEGVVGNGVELNNQLIQGYAGIMVPGTINPSAFKLQFWLGTYTGLDQNGLPYNGVYNTQAVPTKVVESPEFTNISTVITWMQTNATFTKYFTLIEGTIDGSGLVDSHDLEDYSTYVLASGGTEVYDIASNPVLTKRCLIDTQDTLLNYVLSDNYGVNGQNAIVQALENFCVLGLPTSNKYNPQLWIGGGNDANGVATTTAISVGANLDSVTVVHGGIFINSNLGKRLYDSIYQTAAVLGREAGMEPQVPLANKTIVVDGEQHILTDNDAIKLLAAGVICVRFQDGGFEVVKGVTSLQNNQFLINSDSTIPSQQLKRLCRQVRNNMLVNAKIALFNDPAGVNRNTLAPQDVVSWAQGELASMIALPGADNLILDLGGRVPQVTRQQDGYFLKYWFTPNSEVSFLFETGVVVGI